VVANIHQEIHRELKLEYPHVERERLVDPPIVGAVALFAWAAISDNHRDAEPA
jgi:hypothetical protein